LSAVRRIASTRSSRWCSTVNPAALTSASRSTRSGNAIASSAPMNPPIELPTTAALDMRSVDMSSSTNRAYPAIVMFLAGISEPPKPGRSNATTRWSRANTGSCSSQFCHDPDSPWTNTIGGPDPSSITFTRRPPTTIQR
jgi:hypothetical protein